MWLPEVAVAEKIIRSAVVYVFLLVAFRLTGKRQVGQMTPFDLVVLLIGPTPLVRDGKIDEVAMRHELVTRAELHAALRDAGLLEVREARFAILEANDRITAGARGSGA